MNKIDLKIILDLQSLFEEIHGLLIREKEDDWIRGVRSILNMLKDSGNENIDIDEVYKKVKTSYRSMNSGQGSFADFMIWRDDFDEREKINKKFSRLADDAWEILNRY